MKRRARLTMFGHRVPAVSAELRQRVLVRDGGRCGYCYTTRGPFHVDHIVPVHLGGGTTAGNLTVACADCNLRKGAELSRFWARLLVRSGAEIPAASARRLLTHYFRE